MGLPLPLSAVPVFGQGFRPPADTDLTHAPSGHALSTMTTPQKTLSQPCLMFTI